MTKPIVAIVGRPNVGKSTLFNRLVGERLAIIEDLPGTTRDRVYADISWEGHELTLVDTGGLELHPSTNLSQKIKAQIDTAIEEADVIIFLVDVKERVTIPDLELAQIFRKSGKPVILAVNKCDNQERFNQALEFYELALNQPLPISAYHGLGVAELMDKVIAKLPPPSPPTVEEPGLIKVAIVGRPNVGKSMLLNAILGQERVIVDEAPGTTRDAIDTKFEYNGQPMLLIDTAGIRRRGRIGRGIERYSVFRALRAIGRADVVLLLIDASEFLTSQDAHIAGYIKQAYKGMVLVVNKWDLAREAKLKEAEYAEEIRKNLRFLPYVPILFISAKFGWGVEKVLATAREVHQARTQRIDPQQLNEVVFRALESHPPTTKRRFYLRQVAQTEVNPPTFVFTVNDSKLLHFTYKRYLENSLRDAFGFIGTPLRLVFKSGKRKPFKR